jgi:hypothetical protein
MLVGHRSPAVPATTPAHQAASGAVARFQAGLILRFALCLWHVLPNDWQIARAQASMERAGARVPLRAALYGDPVR